MLKGKNILLGITGSIAAYKSTALLRALIKAGADVRVILTPSALSFVTPLTLATLSRNPVYSAYVADEETGAWSNHVELAKWADLMLIAPLTANTLAKMASGVCDNLLMAVYLSVDCPVLSAPAMDLDMAKHWTTANNIQSLKKHGVQVLDFAEGELASGLNGMGRMQEPEVIMEAIEQLFDAGASKLQGKKVLITAGPTYEAIDPVRFIGNHSSGKMGFALAEAASELGAEVTLVCGPSHMISNTRVNRIDVVSSDEMFQAVSKVFPEVDVLIMAAAVADYKPVSVAGHKIKKEDGLESISLEKTKDILSYCGDNKSGQLLVGFALETDHELENARKKLKNKKLDLLVLNSLRDAGAGFGTDTNKITLVYPHKAVEGVLKSKKEVASDILEAIETLL